MKWTEQRDARLREMVETEMDWGGIAQQLRVTRDAVVNRARRLGLKSLAPKGPRLRRDGWTEEMDTKLRELMANERLTLRDVAAHFGKTRNAISARASHLGIPPRGRKGRPVTRDSLKIASEKVEELRAEPVDDEECADGVGLMDLEPFMCRWPIGGSGRHTRFCGAGTIRPYCDGHHAMAYVRPEVRSHAGSALAHTP